MRRGLVAWICGVLVVQCCPALPSRTILVAIAALGVMLTFKPSWRVAAVWLLGVSWSAWVGLATVDATLPASLEGTTLRLAGALVDFPAQHIGVESFVVGDLKFASTHRWQVGHGMVRLAWYSAPVTLQPDMSCVLYVRLQRPHGLRNFSGVNSEQWLFANQIVASGYVIAHQENHCEPRPHAIIARLRAAVTEAIGDAVKDPALASILSGLAVGARADISPSAWQLMRDTGVLHLISVSGLHVGMVALGFYLGTRLLIAALSLRWPTLSAPKWAAVAGLAGALGYSLLAGFAVPTQRTLLMLAVAFGRKFMRCPWQVSDSLLIAAALVLLFEPTASLTLSFWLSFSSIALALYVIQVSRDSQRGLAAHFVLALLLSPLLAFAFQSVALAAPFANMVAIPVVTLGMVPLLLLGTALTALGIECDPCWQFSGFLWELLTQLLSFLVRFLPPSHLPYALDGIGFACVLATVLVLLLPLRAPKIFMPVVLAGVLMLNPRPKLAAGAYQVDVLDVGQGLSVVISTAAHVLVYDAGARYPDGDNIGSEVVVPFLRAFGRHQVDVLLISHRDNDHAGGSAGMLELPLDQLITNVHLPLQHARQSCQRGMQWRWEGVHFEILHPKTATTERDNDDSCVLLVTGAFGRTLLAGDIEAPAERELLATHSALQADILVVPHHGSATSSTAEFITAVAPRYAVISAGYRNRFKHPSPAVVARYRANGSICLNTSESGGVQIVVNRAAFNIALARQVWRRYWDGE